MKLYLEAGEGPSPQSQLARLVAKLMRVEAIQVVQVGTSEADE
jgi:hypothetical protein